MVPAPSVALQQPAMEVSGMSVDLNALYRQKCDSALWKNSVFCAMGGGSRAGEMIGSMRLVPSEAGTYGDRDKSMAWKFYNLFNSVKQQIEQKSLTNWVARKFPWYRQYLVQLDQLGEYLEAGAPIPIESLDGLAEMFHALIQYPIIGNRAKAYLRDTTNVAVFDMPTYVIPAPSPTQSWGQWFRGLFG